MTLKVNDKTVIQLQFYNDEGLIGQFETLPQLAANSILNQESKITRYEAWYRGRSVQIEMMQIEKTAKVDGGKCYDKADLLCRAIISKLNDTDYDMEN